MTRRLAPCAFALMASLSTSACAGDPEFWDAMATGLSNVADEMAWENANCYWGPMPGGERYGPQRRWCPGDYGYAPPVALPPSYHYRRDRDHGGRHRGDRDRDGHGRDGRDGRHRGD